uniref:PC-esterase domain containing 1A n=1 Tax=Rousettus aegyptiacus TaxID=9407 RepID=A0A7J8DJB8_ROUAE|nr:PC-esterase domain containing 1A [Rousettus aegyptiacus]
MESYRKNLERVFLRMDQVLPDSCLLVWNMAMPLGERVTGGFLLPELQPLEASLRRDVVEGNFYSATSAGDHYFDVLDLHFLALSPMGSTGAQWSTGGCHAVFPAAPTMCRGWGNPAGSGPDTQTD